MEAFLKTEGDQVDFGDSLISSDWMTQPLPDHEHLRFDFRINNISRSTIRPGSVTMSTSDQDRR
jgi:hypothetical protein